MCVKVLQQKVNELEINQTLSNINIGHRIKRHLIQKVYILYKRNSCICSGNNYGIKGRIDGRTIDSTGQVHEA